MAAHSSIFAWKTPWTEEPGRLQSLLQVKRAQISLKRWEWWSRRCSFWPCWRWRWRMAYLRRTGRTEPTINVQREGETPEKDLGAEEQTSPMPEEEGAGGCPGRAGRGAASLWGRGQPLPEQYKACAAALGTVRHELPVQPSTRMETGSSS